MGGICCKNKMSITINKKADYKVPVDDEDKRGGKYKSLQDLFLSDNPSSDNENFPNNPSVFNPMKSRSNSNSYLRRVKGNKLKTKRKKKAKFHWDFSRIRSENFEERVKVKKKLNTSFGLPLLRGELLLAKNTNENEKIIKINEENIKLKEKSTDNSLRKIKLNTEDQEENDNLSIKRDSTDTKNSGNFVENLNQNKILKEKLTKNAEERLNEKQKDECEEDKDYSRNINNDHNKIPDRISISSSESKKIKQELFISTLRNFQQENSKNESNRKISLRDNLSEQNVKENSFIREFLKEINNARLNYISYCKKIDFYSKFIKKISNKYYLQIDIDKKISNFSLFKGPKSFEEAKTTLKSLQENYKLEKLQLVEELKIPFPYNNIPLAKSKKYIDSKFEELKLKMAGKYEVTNHHYDISFKDAELSILMQIIDDNLSNCRRRNNLLRKEAKYVGINYGLIGKDLIIVYLVFAK